MVWANSVECMAGSRPPPYSSHWISTMAALDRPARRGMAHGVAVGFPELPGRAVHGELPHLFEGAVLQHVL